VHASLAALVEQKGAELEGRRILLYSYGSGLAGTLFSLYARRVQGAFSLARLAESVRPRAYWIGIWSPGSGGRGVYSCRGPSRFRFWPLGLSGINLVALFIR